MTHMISSFTQKLIPLNIEHLTPDTRAILDSDDLGMPIAIMIAAEGPFINVSDFLNLVPDMNEVPSDLAQVVEFCDNNGIDWIKLSENGHFIDELPRYDAEGKEIGNVK